MIVVSGVFDIDPADRDAAIAAATKMGEASRQEDGCNDYAFWADLTEPGRFRVFEEWESIEALQTHFQTAHMAEFRESMGSFRILDRSVFRYEVTSREPL